KTGKTIAPTLKTEFANKGRSTQTKERQYSLVFNDEKRRGLPLAAVITDLRLLSCASDGNSVTESQQPIVRDGQAPCRLHTPA
ncbi:MAG: hypothetical protein CMM05_09155, partial [Rhodopirellula sp.]|nr:hypothetical protein [Rhodopirellula sp.]